MDDAVHPLSLRLDRYPLDIFTCLWLKNTRTKPLSICIPDTVLLDRGVLLHWYFTSKTGELLRRKKDKTTKPKLLRFLHETAPGPIAAVYVHLASSANPEQRVLVVEHLSLAGVESLLNNPVASTHGMLQKFVLPKSCYNNMVQTVFAHDTCQSALRCTNPHMFVNGLIPLELRAVTFERPNTTTQKAIGNPSTLQTLTTLNREVVGHVAATVGMAITRQVLHFKMGADDKLYFLWPSLVVFENQEAIVPCQLVTPARLEPLIALTPDVATPSACPACANPYRVRSGPNPMTAATFLVTFKAIVAAHRASKTSDQDQNQNQTTPTVPSAIRAAYGPLSDDKFATLVKDSSFLYRTVQVCEACCRDINTTAIAHDNAPQAAASSATKPRPLSQSTRWRSWKDPRQLVAVALGPKKPQSARNLLRKPEHVAPVIVPSAAVVPASPCTPRRRKSLTGPSLQLVSRPADTADNQTHHAPPAYDKVEFVSKPRPVSAASTLLPSRPRTSAISPSCTVVSPKQRQRNHFASALTSLRTAIRASAPNHNPSLRSLLARHGIEPQHSTVTIHELFTLCYKASTPVSLNDLKTIALFTEPRDNLNAIDIDAIDAMLLQSPGPSTPDKVPSVVVTAPMPRPKSCVAKPTPFTKPQPPPTMTPKPPMHPTPSRPSSGPFQASARSLVPSPASQPRPPEPCLAHGDSTGPACPEDIGLTDEEAACLYNVLVQGS